MLGASIVIFIILGVVLVVAVKNIGVSGLGCIRTSNMVYIRGGIGSRCSCDINIIGGSCSCSCDCYIVISIVVASIVLVIYFMILIGPVVVVFVIFMLVVLLILIVVIWDIPGVVISIVVVIRFRILI